MKVHVNSLDNIASTFVTEYVLPKYITLWQNAGEKAMDISIKSFGITAGFKILLKNGLLRNNVFVKLITDPEGCIDIDIAKEEILSTLQEYTKNNRELVIPTINWSIDSEDVNKIYEIAKKYGDQSCKPQSTI